MIKLFINNDLEGKEYSELHKFSNGIGSKMEKVYVRKFEPYDEDKWKDGKIYNFETLKEVINFIDTCDIDFTDEYACMEFSTWNWEEIDIDYFINPKEDNRIDLYIGTHQEWRD